MKKTIQLVTGLILLGSLTGGVLAQNVNTPAAVNREPLYRKGESREAYALRKEQAAKMGAEVAEKAAAAKAAADKAAAEKAAAAKAAADKAAAIKVASEKATKEATEKVAAAVKAAVGKMNADKAAGGKGAK